MLDKPKNVREQVLRLNEHARPILELFFKHTRLTLEHVLNILGVIEHARPTLEHGRTLLVISMSKHFQLKHKINF